MLHVDPTTPAGVADTLMHAAPVVAPVLTAASLWVGRLLDRRRS